MKYKLHSFFEDPPPPPAQRCEWGGCHDEGLYRAPQSRTRLREYYNFCLAHVQEYNGNWNYYADMSEEEFERSRKDDFTWGRPTWTFAGRGFFDPFDFLGDEEGEFSEKQRERAQKAYSSNSEEGRALQLMDLSFPFTKETLRVCYKKLAKKYHPDANGGCQKSEEKLKSVNAAYEILKKLI